MSENFFYIKAFGVEIGNKNFILPLNEKNTLVIKNEISEMKQTAAPALGIPGLKTVFVQSE